MRAEVDASKGVTMVTMDDLVQWKNLLDEIPRDPWVHVRRDKSGRWQIIERGESPLGWKELSRTNPLFRIDIHNPVELGDRFAVGEDFWEAVEQNANGQWTFVKVDLA